MRMIIQKKDAFYDEKPVYSCYQTTRLFLVIFRSVWPLIFSCSLLLLPADTKLKAQVVSPLQGGHYSPGIKNIRDMANPPSGLFALWYNAYVSSSKYYDQNGRAFSSIRLDQIYPGLPNIEVSTRLKGFTTVPALFWASKPMLPGGAKFMAGVSYNYVSADVSFITERSGIIIDTTFTRRSGGKNSGFSDLFVAPLGLSWGDKKFDFAFLYGFYAPTGKYATGSSDGVGLGFWTHQFQGYGYFYPLPEKSSAIMLGLTYELNSRIKDADVKPGNRFSLEYGISQYISERAALGVHGAHNWQVSDDKGAKVYWNASVHDRKSSLFFNADYWAVRNKLMFGVKYGFDYGIRQRFRNDTWMLNFLFIISSPNSTNELKKPE